MRLKTIFRMRGFIEDTRHFLVRIDGKTDALTEKIDGHVIPKLSALEQKVDAHIMPALATLPQIEQKVDTLVGNHVMSKFKKQDEKLNAINGKLDQLLKQTNGNHREVPDD